MSRKSCGNCYSMKAKLPIRKGRFIYTEATASCVDENGVLFRQGKVFKLGTYDKDDYIDWKLQGSLCRQYQEWI